MSRCKQANKVEKNRSQARPEVSPQVEGKGTARLQVAGGGFCSEAAGLPGRGSGWGTPAVSTTGSNQKSRRPGRRPKPEHPSLAPFLSPEPGEKHAPQVLPVRRGAWRPATAPWVPVRLTWPASWAGVRPAHEREQPSLTGAWCRAAWSGPQLPGPQCHPGTCSPCDFRRAPHAGQPVTAGEAPTRPVGLSWPRVRGPG